MTFVVDELPSAAKSQAGMDVLLLDASASIFRGSITLCDGGIEALLRPDAPPTSWEGQPPSAPGKVGQSDR